MQSHLHDVNKEPEMQFAIWFNAILNSNQFQNLSIIGLTSLQKKGLVELAAYLGNNDLIEKFSKSVLVHPQSHIRTAAYWAAVHDQTELFKSLCSTDEMAVYTLWQLEQDKHELAFKKYYAIVSESVRKKFNDDLGKIIKKRKINLDSRYDFAYDALCKGDAKNFKKFCYSLEVLYAVTSCAYQERNFVALYQCIRYWQTLTIHDKDLFVRKMSGWAVLSEHGEMQSEVDHIPAQTHGKLLRFWLVANNIHPYDLIFANRDIAPESRDQLIEIVWGREGFLQFLIQKILMSQDPSDREFFLQFEKTDNEIFEVLIKILKSQYEDPAFSQLLTQPKNLSLTNKLANIKFLPETEKAINTACKTLGIGIRCNQLRSPNELPNDMWEKITNDFLLNKDNKPNELGFMCVSRDFYLFSKKSNPEKQDKIKNQAKTLEDKIQQTDKEIKELKERTLDNNQAIQLANSKILELKQLETSINDEIKQANFSRKNFLLASAAFIISVIGIVESDDPCVRIISLCAILGSLSWLGLQPAWDEKNASNVYLSDLPANLRNEITNSIFPNLKKQNNPSMMCLFAMMSALNTEASQQEREATNSNLYCWVELNKKADAKKQLIGIRSIFTSRILPAETEIEAKLKCKNP